MAPQQKTTIFVSSLFVHSSYAFLSSWHHLCVAFPVGVFQPIIIHMANELKEAILTANVDLASELIGLNSVQTAQKHTPWLLLHFLYCFCLTNSLALAHATKTVHTLLFPSQLQHLNCSLKSWMKKETRRCILLHR